MLEGDEEIVRRIRAGERTLFEVLFRRHNPRLQRVLRSMLRNFGEVDDVLQETWLRAFAHLDQFSGRGRFAGWITRIAIYQAWAMAGNGRKGSQVAAKASALIRASADPEHASIGRELNEAVETAIGALPEKYRLVLTLRTLEGLSTSDVARSLELSCVAVKARLHRARGLLRRELTTRIRTEKRSVCPPAASAGVRHRWS